MKNLLLSLTGAMCFAATASATSVQYTLTATGTANEYTYIFTSNANLSQYQGLVIKFPASSTPPTYTNLENPIGGIGFTLTVHQPNFGPDLAGDLTVMRSAVGSGTPSGFSVEGTYSTNSPLTSLPFLIMQFDSNGAVVLGAGINGVLESGTATLAGVPEPSSALLSIVGIAFAGVYLTARRC